MQKRESGLKVSDVRPHFYELLELIPGISIQGYDLEGVISYWDQASEATYGYTAAEAFGKRLTDLIIPEELKGAFKEALLEAAGARSGDIKPLGELKLLHKNGSTVSVFSIHTIVQHENQQPWIFCIDIDFSERERVERFLRESEDRWKLLFSSASDAIVITDYKKEIIVDCNPRALEMYGCTREQLIGAPTHFCTPAVQSDGRSTREKAIEMLLQARHGGPVIFEWDTVKLDGTPVKSEISLSVIKIAGQRLVQIIARDITERRMLERINQLRETAQRTADLIRFLPDPTFARDMEGKVIAWNRAIEELTGITAEQMLGKGNYEYAIPFYGSRRRVMADQVIDFDPEEAKLYLNIQRENDCLIAETEVIRPNGEKVYYWTKAAPLFDKDNQVIGAIESIRDITGIKQTELSLLESNQKYQRLLQNASDFIVLVDADTGVIMEVNSRTESLTGNTSGELVGRHFTAFHHLDDEDGFRRWFVQVVENRGVSSDYEGESYFVNKEGQSIPVEIRASMIDTGGKRIVQGVFRDLTARKRMEKELVDREVELATQRERQKLSSLKKMVAQHIGLGDIGFYSKPMGEIYRQAMKYYCERSIPVLIQGETGTGKEIIAKLIHYGNMEALGQPFVDINCAAISPSLFESELFGYEAGSFTGGLAKGQKGKFDIACGGTLFLDEVAELPLELQGKLLRVIQEKQFYRVGGLKKVKTEVRIICATNTNLEEAVSRGAFRKDLYYRLKVGYIFIPPLRERQDDILPLANMFLLEIAQEKDKLFERISPEAARLLMSYRWPGNIRELRNVMEWVVFMHNDEELMTQHLGILSQSPRNLPSNGSLDAIEKSHTLDVSGKAFKNLVDDLLFRTLEINNGNISKTARALGISRNTLYKRIKRQRDNRDH